MKLLVTVSILSILLLLAMTGAQAQNVKPMLPAGAGSGASAGEAALAPSPSFVNLPAGQAEEPGVQKARQLLDQMIQALGGRTWMELQDVEQQGRTYVFFHGEPSGEGALYRRFWKWPDKQRMEFTNQRELPLVSGLPPVRLKSVAWAVIYNGNEGYEVTYKGATEQEKDALEDYLRQRNHSLEWVLRKWLKEPGVAIFYEGPAVAERKPAERVTIINAQNDTVTLWIDSHTHLPLKKAFTWRDPKTRYHTDEAEGYENFRPAQGIMTPFSITRYKNDEAVNQRFLTQVTINKGLPDTLFDAKAGPAAAKK